MITRFNMIYIVSNCVEDLKSINIPPETTELIVENNTLYSLEGCPSGIKKLKLSGNFLTSFKYCPEDVTHIDVSHNKFTSIEDCPSTVTHLCISSNMITSLVGCPNGLVSLDCSYTHITDFVGVNAGMTSIIAAYTKATSMKGLPTKTDMNDVNLSYSYIKDCSYCPNTKMLDLSCNRITSLDGCQDSLIEELIVTKNHLTSLEGCPSTVKIVRCIDCGLKTIRGLPSKLTLLECNDHVLFEPSESPELDDLIYKWKSD